MPLSIKPIKIEITYSNSETSKLGVKKGDVVEAYREYYMKSKWISFDGKPEMKIVKVWKQQCWFEIDGVKCVAYKCQHDDDAMLPVTTCKLVKE